MSSSVILLISCGVFQILNSIFNRHRTKVLVSFTIVLVAHFFQGYCPFYRNYHILIRLFLIFPCYLFNIILMSAGFVVIFLSFIHFLISITCAFPFSLSQQNFYFLIFQSLYICIHLL